MAFSLARCTRVLPLCALTRKKTHTQCKTAAARVTKDTHFFPAAAAAAAIGTPAHTQRSNGGRGVGECVRMHKVPHRTTVRFVC